MIYAIFNFLVKAAEVPGPGNVPEPDSGNTVIELLLFILLVALLVVTIISLIRIKHEKREIETLKRKVDILESKIK